MPIVLTIAPLAATVPSGAPFTYRVTALPEYTAVTSVHAEPLVFTAEPEVTEKSGLWPAVTEAPKTAWPPESDKLYDRQHVSSPLYKIVPEDADGLTHALTVTAEPGAGVDPIVAYPLDQFRSIAPLQIFPAAHEAPPTRAAALPLPEESAAVVPEPSSKFQ